MLIFARFFTALLTIGTGAFIFVNYSLRGLDGSSPHEFEAMSLTQYVLSNDRWCGFVFVFSVLLITLHLTLELKTKRSHPMS